MHELLNASRINLAARAAKEKNREVWLSDDDGSRGTGRLLLRVGANGIHRFYYRATFAPGESPRTLAIGMYWRVTRRGYFTLNQARKKVLELSSQTHFPKMASSPRSSTFVEQPSMPHKTTDGVLVDKESAGSQGTFLELCQLYAQSLEDDGKKSARDVKGMVKRNIEPSKLAHKQARDVTTNDVTELLRAVIASGAGYVAKKIRTLIHAAYARALKSELDPSAPLLYSKFSVTRNPVTGIDALSQYNNARNRFLRDSEFLELWRHLQLKEDSSIALRAVRLCILLAGQRGEQMVSVTLKDVDLEAKTILLLDPKGRRRVARHHLLPLCTQAELEVKWLVANAQSLGSDFLFPGARLRTVCRQETMSDVVLQIRRRMEQTGHSTEQFAFMDLRRTIETKLTSMNVSQDHRAQLLSHGLGGVQNRHYDRHDYMPVKREILQMWEKYLAGLPV